MNSKRTLALAAALAATAAALLWIAAPARRPAATLTYSEFLDRVSQGQVAGAVLNPPLSGAVEVTCRLANGQTARTVLPADARDALREMRSHQVNIEIQNSRTSPLRPLLNAAPFLLLLALWALRFFRKPPPRLRRSLLG